MNEQYWGRRAEMAEAEVERLWHALDLIWQITATPTHLKINMGRIQDIAGRAVTGRTISEHPGSMAEKTQG